MVMNGKPLGNLVIGLSMEGTQMAKTLDEVKRVTKMATSEMKANLAVLGNAGDQYGKTESKIQGLNKVMKAQEAELSVLQKKHKEASGTYGENSKEAQKYATQINNLVRRQSAYGKELKEAEVKQNEFKRGTQELKKEIELSERSTNAQVQTLKAQGKAYKANVTELAGLKQQQQMQAKVITDEKAKLTDLIAAKGRDSSETKAQMVVIDEAVSKHAKLGESVKDLSKNYGNMSAATADFKDNIQSVEARLDEFAEKSAAVGKSLTTKVSLPIAGSFLAAAKASIGFESAFTGVKKTVEGTTAELEGISKGIRNMALEIPASTTEISAVAEAAGQLGIETPNILGFTRSMVDMGQATNLASEEAAMQLAKFANVTQMNQKDFDRLGSSIVDLGNNYAATESNIVAMGTRLSGAGAQIGMSQADIMGLGASLASVGIEAEMGGSAISKVMVNMKVASKMGLEPMRELEAATGMTRRELELLANHDGESFKALAIDLGVTTTEMKNVMKAGKDLENFGAIAGMTAEQFKQAFEKDAVGAIGSFVNGLGTAEEKGTSAIELLDEMGIREIRLRDALLRAGNANELFTGAVARSNKAWDENNALTKEAETRYNTTESKINLMKNTLVEFGIQMGNLLLPSIRDFVKSLTGLLKGFNSLDDGTKKLIVSTGLVAMAIGPLILGVSKLALGLKLVTRSGGGVVTFLGLFSKSAGLSTASALSLTNGVAGATTGLGSMGAGAVGATASMGAMLLPIAGVVAGTVALGAAVYVGVKKYREFKKEQDETAKKVEQFGANVSDATAKAADSFVTMRDEAKTQLTLLETATDENGKKISEQIVKNYSGMAEEVVKAITKTREETVGALNEIQLDVGVAGDEWLAKIMNEATSSFDDDVNQIEKAKNRINELLQEVGGNLQNLNAAQKQEFDSLKAYVDENTGVFADSYKDQERLLNAWNERKDTLSEKNYEKEQTSSKKMRDKALKAAEEDYKKGSAALTKAYDSGAIKSREDYDGLLNALNVQRNKQQAKANAAYAQTDMALSKKIENTGKFNIETMQTAEEAKMNIQGLGYKWFDDHTKKIYDSESAWIKATKKHNDEYLKNTKELSNATVKNLNGFEKSQREIYETIGLLPSEAAKRAKEDRDKIELELTKTGSQMSAVAKKIHADYVEGLKTADEGQLAEVAQSWGLDLANEELIDFGKYGQKTAQQFFDDFKSGSEVGAAEARIYFKTKIESITEVDLAKIGEENIATFRQGLLSGALTFDELAEKFGASVINLFPNDLSAIGELEVESLKKGLESGKIDTQALKDRYAEQYTNLFEKNLTDLGQEEIVTLKKGLEIGLYSPDDLKATYAEQLKNYFSADLANLSQDSMETLKVGFELGVPGTKEKLDQISKLVKDSATIDLGDKGKMSMDTLVDGYRTGKLSIDEFMTGYRQFMDDQSKLDLNANGNFTINQLGNGMEQAKSYTTHKASDVFQGVQKELEMGPISYEKGKIAVNNLAQGIVDYTPQPKQKATDVFQTVQTQFDMADTSRVKGQVAVNNLAQGLTDYVNEPQKSANQIVQGVGAQFNNVVTASNSLTENLGGTAKLPFIGIPKFKMGTQGALRQSTAAIVGDGGEHELISYPDGKMALSPNKDTLTHLPAGAQVFNGGQTKQMLGMMKGFVNIPKFEKGTGANILDWFGGKIEGIFNFISKPLELWNKIISNSFDESSFAGTAGKNIGGGAKIYADKQSDWIKNLFSSFSVAPAGLGAQRWQPLVMKSLALNGLPVTPAYTNAWLSQIQSESGGNEKAVQGGYTDVNTLSGDLAKGLLQTISATFNAYKHPGHGDIFNGFDNMLAAMNYAKNRYGPAEMLGVIGHGHGYANGGIVSQHQIAQIAEGNRPEAIVPLDPIKRTRAMRILATASRVVGFETGSQVIVEHDQSGVIEELQKQNLLSQQQNSYLQMIIQLLSKNPEQSGTISDLLRLLNQESATEYGNLKYQIGG